MSYWERVGSIFAVLGGFVVIAAIVTPLVLWAFHSRVGLYSAISIAVILVLAATFTVPALFP